MSKRVVIIGGGAAGTLVAIHMASVAKSPLTITVVEPRERLGEGIAYSTPDFGHLLNVPAGGMSAFSAEPDHFRSAVDCAASDFVARRTYSRYLRDTLRATLEKSPHVNLQHLRDSASAIEVSPPSVDTSASGVVSGDAVVLALGNAAPTVPEWIARGPAASTYRVVVDPWLPGVLDSIGVDDRVLCVGTGLTFVDVAMTLARRGVNVRGVSRHGLLPQMHAPMAEPPPLPDDLATLRAPSDVLRWIRLQPDWRSAFASLRPVTQRIWCSWTTFHQSQFLRHCRRQWDVHRHRMSQDVANEFHTLADAGLIAIQRGDARALAATSEFSVVMLCTGPDDSALLGSAPLASLVLEGSVCPGPHGIGIATDPRSGAVQRSDGSNLEGVYAIGPLRRGTLWECTAIPEIRAEAEHLAAQLVERLCV